jgi:hypothetical protein
VLRCTQSSASPTSKKSNPKCRIDSLEVVVRLLFFLPLLLLSVTDHERSGMRFRVTAVTASPQPSSRGVGEEEEAAHGKRQQVQKQQ